MCATILLLFKGGIREGGIYSSFTGKKLRSKKFLKVEFGSL